MRLAPALLACAALTLAGCFGDCKPSVGCAGAGDPCLTVDAGTPCATSYAQCNVCGADGGTTSWLTCQARPDAGAQWVVPACG